MYISDTDKDYRRLAVTGFGYLVISLLCALFGLVYEFFSHGVYSGFMLYAFLFPLVGGTLPFYGLALWGSGRYPGRSATRFYHAGVAALTVGSLVQGVLEIYGTTNRLVRFYWYAGVALMGLGLLSFLFKRSRE